MKYGEIELQQCLELMRKHNCSKNNCIDCIYEVNESVCVRQMILDGMNCTGVGIE